MYIVEDIIEPDFGCEGLPDGEEPCCEVILKDNDGKTMTMKVADAELYGKNITVGCAVVVEEGHLEPADPAL